MIGSSSFIEGFEKGLLGKKIGETVDLQLTFPKGYHVAELAGKDVVFTVTVNSISRPKMPEITDEIINKLGYSSETEYNEELKKTYVNDYIWNLAIQNSKVIKYPEKEVENFIDDKVNYVKDEAEQAGTTLENYFSQNGLTEKEYREYLADYANSYVMQKMIFYSVARKENIEVQDTEIETFAKENFNGTELSDEDRLLVYESLLQQKVCDFLVSKAKIS